MLCFLVFPKKLWKVNKKNFNKLAITIESLNSNYYLPHFLNPNILKKS